MLLSARLGIEYPNPDNSDEPDIPLHLKNLLDPVDAEMLVYKIGTHTARLAAAHMEGVFWFESDTGETYFDDGSAWNALSRRLLTGRVNADGTIAGGSGFSVNKTGTGVYVITFTDAFPAVPDVTASAYANACGANTASVSTGGVTVNVWDASNAGADIDRAFTFTAHAVQ